MSNIGAGCFNYWLAKGGIGTLMVYRENHQLNLAFTMIIVPYFAFTEFVPSIIVASTISKFSKVLTPENPVQLRDG